MYFIVRFYKEFDKEHDYSNLNVDLMAQMIARKARRIEKLDVQQTAGESRKFSDQVIDTAKKAILNLNDA